MTPEVVITTGQQAMAITVMLVLALLLPALAVGLLVSMFQAATQINEMTLSFIPKLLVTIGVLAVGGHWMVGLLTDFARRLFTQIPGLIG